MSTPMMSFGGIASGLPTDLVDQLIDAERQPLRRLEQRQSELDVVGQAWSSVQTRLSSVREAVDAIRRPEGLAAQHTATSSNDDVVGVSVTGQPDEGTLTFSVEQLAQRMQQTSADAFSGLDDAIGDRALSVNGQAIELEADATLGDLVEAINAADLGVGASALEVRPGERQLVLVAEDTGAANGFTVEASGWDNGFAVTQEARDAELDVGGITVTRSGNQVDDLVEGLALDLRSARPGSPVTIGAERDIDEAVGRVTAVVEEINKALEHIDELSRYDPETEQAAPLQGETTLRRIANDLRTAISAPVDGATGEATLASDAGINLTRDGRLEVDEETLRAAFEADFEGTASLFARTGGSSASEVADVSSTSRETEAGEYMVEITKAARVASLTGAIEIPPPGNPHTYRVTGGSGSVVVSVHDGMSVSQAVEAIRSALAEAGIESVEADEHEGELRLRETRHGSAHEITVEEETDPGTWQQVGSAAGADVEVLVDGEAHVGSGRQVAIEDGAADGLRLSAAGAAGQTAALSVTQGIGGALDRVLAAAEGPGGSVRRAQDSLEGQSRRVQDRMDAFERRLEVRETALRRKFTAMESTLARLTDEGQWLQGQLSGLAGGQ